MKNKLIFFLILFLIYSLNNTIFSQWQNLNQDITNTTSNQDFGTFNDMLYFGTNKGLFIYSDILSSTPVEDEVVTLEHFYAAPAKPNPANDIVRAGIYWDASVYDVEYAEKGIYNILGNKISDGKDLQVKNTQPYSAEIVWNCSKASSGLYFIVLNYIGQIGTIPVVVSRKKI